MRSLLLIPIVAAAAGAQQVPARTLPKHDIEYTEPFSQLAGLRELRDGRVIVSDRRDKSLQLIDLAARKATPIGHEGAGPLEYALPIRALAMPGDSTYVVDALNTRFLVVGPDGKPVRTFSPIADGADVFTGARAGAPVISRGGDGRGDGGRGDAGRGDAGRAGGTGGRGGGGPVIIGGGSGPLALIQARATDAKGNFYFAGPPFTPGPDGFPVAADSVPVIRSDALARKQDTAAWLAVPKNSAEIKGSGTADNRSVSVSVGGNTPFVNGDEWAVFPDGRVAVVRVKDFHVDVYANGRRVSGAPVAFTPVRIGEAEKGEWRAISKGAQGINMTVNNGQTSRSVSNTPSPDPATWPETKSPFATGAVYAAPNGELWVFHQRPAKDPIPVAEVFGANGQLVGRLSLPARTRVVGFGAKAVYVVRMDDDDLQYLQRVPMTWTGCPAELKENCAGR